MSRAQSLLPSSSSLCDMYMTAIRHFFPQFWTWVDALDDPRKVQGRCQYSQRILFATELFRCFAGIRSHREMDSVFNGEGGAILENLSRITGHRLDHVPRSQTINYWLSSLSPDGLKKIMDHMVTHLRQEKRLEECREPLGQTLMLGSDGTGLFSTIRPIGHSTIRHHSDGRCARHVYVLLASFLSPGGIVIPGYAEFIENGKDYNPEFDKQDCEHKAQLKLFEAIHETHPRLPVTVLMDALSLDYPQMANCIEKRWDFVISYRDGAVKGLAEAIAAALRKEDGNAKRHGCCRTEKNGTVFRKEFTWCEVTYKFGKALDRENFAFPVTYAKMTLTVTTAEGKEEVKNYERITSHFLSSGNIEAFFEYMGGTRWCEENQGFNEMKNLGLNIEHAYGCRGEAAVNHFLLQMIAFIIMQLAGKTDLYGKMESLMAESEDEAEKKAKTSKDNPVRTLRNVFSSLMVICRKFLMDLTSRVMRVIDEKIVASMRIRWAYG